MRRSFPFGFFLSVALVLFFVPPAEGIAGIEARETLPSVLLIVADDLGPGDLGCYGAPDIATPRLDRLAAEGVRLTRFYASAPECSPTRAALLSGRYPQRVGGLECAIGVGDAGRYDDAMRLAARGELGLPPELGVLPRILGEKGYATAAVGKWHLGYRERFRPLRHGFDHSFGPLGGAIDYFWHTEPAGEFLGAELPGEPMLYLDDRPCRREGYITELISAEAARWLEALPRDRPFFLYVPYTAPHSPYQGPGDRHPAKRTADAWNRGSRAKYAEMVEALDRAVGSLLDAVDRAGRRSSTLVVFFSDNGPAKYGSTGGLRGHKGQLFEGGIRVPGILRWPGRLPAGRASPRVSISMDLTASILAACRAKAPAGREPDGIDVVEAIREAEPERPRALFWRARRGERTEKAVRSGDLKYLRRELAPGRVEEYLFDLARDERETRDLRAERPEDLRRLKELLRHWEVRVRPVR